MVLAPYYGLTRDELNQIYTRANGHCECCGKKRTRLVVEHCHVTDKVRGMVCASCNALISRLERGYRIVQPHIVEWIK